jgi:hypothetical protein
MGAAVIIIMLAGLVLPITLILAAVVFDCFVLLWYAYRLWHDRWAPRVWALVRMHGFPPPARRLHRHDFAPRAR